MSRTLCRREDGAPHTHTRVCERCRPRALERESSPSRPRSRSVIDGRAGRRSRQARLWDAEDRARRRVPLDDRPFVYARPWNVWPTRSRHTAARRRTAVRTGARASVCGSGERRSRARNKLIECRKAVVEHKIYKAWVPARRPPSVRPSRRRSVRCRRGREACAHQTGPDSVTPSKRSPSALAGGGLPLSRRSDRPVDWRVPLPAGRQGNTPRHRTPKAPARQGARSRAPVSLDGPLASRRRLRRGRVRSRALAVGPGRSSRTTRT